jgi:hypothetical protein
MLSILIIYRFIQNRIFKEGINNFLMKDIIISFSHITHEKFFFSFTSFPSKQRKISDKTFCYFQRNNYFSISNFRSTAVASYGQRGPPTIFQIIVCIEENVLMNLTFS